jgi:hypothetical protein
MCLRGSRREKGSGGEQERARLRDKESNKMKKSAHERRELEGQRAELRKSNDRWERECLGVGGVEGGERDRQAERESEKERERKCETKRITKRRDGEEEKEREEEETTHLPHRLASMSISVRQALHFLDASALPGSTPNFRV